MHRHIESYIRISQLTVVVLIRWLNSNESQLKGRHFIEAYWYCFFNFNRLWTFFWVFDSLNMNLNIIGFVCLRSLKHKRKKAEHKIPDPTFSLDKHVDHTSIFERIQHKYRLI